LKTKNTILRDVLAIFSTKVSILLISVVSIILLARVLGSEGRGLLAAALIYPQLLTSLSEGGMRQAAVLFLGKEKADPSEVFGSLIFYILVAGFLGFNLVYLLLYFTGNESFNNSIILVTALLLPFSLMINALQGVFLGKQNVKAFNSVLWVQKLAYVGLLLLFYFIDTLTVFTAILATTVSTCFSAMYAVCLVKKFNDFALSFKFATFYPMLKIGMTYAVALFLIQANYKIDILLMSWLSSSHELGNYSVAVQLGEIIWQLPSSVLLVLMAKTANSRSDDIIYTVVKSTRLTLFVTLILTCLMLLLSRMFIGLIFGEDYLLVNEVLVYLAPGIIFACLFKTINAYFAGEGKTGVAIKVMFVTVLTNILGNLLLIPEYGAVGAAIATSLSYLVSGVLIVCLFCKLKVIKVKDLVIVKSTDFRVRKIE